MGEEFEHPRPIPLKDRASYVFVEYGQLDVVDGSFVVVDANGVRTVIPVGGLAAVMLEPGTRVSHAAVALAARVGTLLIWVGEAGVRLYAAGQPGGARSDRLLWQFKLASDDGARLKVVRRMYEIRFGEPPPANRSVDQLRGIEGSRVRKTYQILAQRYGVDWNSRNYERSDWDAADLPNRCLSTATSCLYGLVEASVIAAGYAPSVGFIHTGKPLSFVYDVADLIKFETVVPIAFSVASRATNGKLDGEPGRAVRRACRDSFRKEDTTNRIFSLVDDVLSAGGLMKPKPPPDALPVAFESDRAGDEGHR